MTVERYFFEKWAEDRSMSVDDLWTSPAAEAITRIVELLLSSRLSRFTGWDRKLTFEFLDTTVVLFSQEY
jgi:hypothetical protein